MSTFPQRLAALASALLAFVLCSYGLVSIATYKPYGVPDALRGEWEMKQAEIKEAEKRRIAQLQRPAHSTNASLHPQGKPTADAVPQPIAVTPITEHDFGMLDPGISATHTFTIENQGQAPLVIAAGDTSCKCTLSETSQEVVPPGSSAQITLTWNTGTARQYYRQYAVIRTNDPSRREIELAVAGTVKALLAFSADEIVIPAADPGTGVRSSILVYSQSLDAFDISKIDCLLPGFLYEVLPASADEIESLGATFAVRIAFSTDGSLPIGEFSEIMRVHMHRAGMEPEYREISVHGRVLSPITFYGAAVHSEEGLDLGTVQQGQEKTSTLIVKVRGNTAPDRLVISRIQPSFLQATVEPHTTRPGVHTLTIKVPADAPQTIFNREQDHGFIEVADPHNPNNRNSIPLLGAVLNL